MFLNETIKFDLFTYQIRRYIKTQATSKQFVFKVIQCIVLG